MEQEHKVKSKIIAAALIFITVMLAVVYFYPRLTVLYENRRDAKVTADCKVFTDKILERAQEEQSKNKKKKLDLKKLSDEITQELDVKYCDTKTPLCCMVEYDKKTNTVVVTGFDATQEVITRTVINPPSFVTFDRMERKVGARRFL